MTQARLQLETDDARTSRLTTAYEARLCYHYLVIEEHLAASAALDEVIGALEHTGVTSALRALTQDVWGSNVDRFEPDELGDTPTSLGFQAYQNFSQRALRRAKGDRREAATKHWSIDGLTVGAPKNVLTLTFFGNRIIVLKVPFAQARRADFTRLATWENQSKARAQMAARNTQVLGGFVSAAPGQDALLPAGSEFGVVRDFILAWAGEQQSELTAGWLGVPVLGASPFLVSRSLWWDEGVGHSDGVPVAPSVTTPFDERQVAAPSVTLKPRHTGSEQA